MAVAVDNLEICAELSMKLPLEGDFYDLAVLDDECGGAVPACGRIQKAGVRKDDDGVAHAASPQRADREASTAMRAATPIST